MRRVILVALLLAGCGGEADGETAATCAAITNPCREEMRVQHEVCATDCFECGETLTREQYQAGGWCWGEYDHLCRSFFGEECAQAHAAVNDCIEAQSSDHCS